MHSRKHTQKNKKERKDDLDQKRTDNLQTSVVSRRLPTANNQSHCQHCVVAKQPTLVGNEKYHRSRHTGRSQMAITGIDHQTILSVRFSKLSGRTHRLPGHHSKRNHQSKQHKTLQRQMPGSNMRMPKPLPKIAECNHKQGGTESKNGARGNSGNCHGV